MLGLKQLAELGVMEALATAFASDEDVRSVLESSGYPASRIPRNPGTPLGLWQAICREIDHGITSGGFEALLRAALERYPGNRTFQSAMSGIAPPGPAANHQSAPAQRGGNLAVPMTVNVFIAYSHEDTTLCRELQTQLKVLELDATIRVSSDEHLSPGAPWEVRIDQWIDSAQIVLALISASFFASDHCNRELKAALSHAESERAVVIPVILHAVEWEHLSIGRLHALPSRGKPVLEWESRERAWVDVVKGVRKTAKEFSAGYKTAHNSGEQE